MEFSKVHNSWRKLALRARNVLKRKCLQYLCRQNVIREYQIFHLEPIQCIQNSFIKLEELQIYHKMGIIRISVYLYLFILFFYFTLFNNYFNKVNKQRFKLRKIYFNLNQPLLHALRNATSWTIIVWPSTLSFNQVSAQWARGHLGRNNHIIFWG